MRPVALAFAGGIGSGKTTLSTEVAERLSWPRVAFGDYVRGVAIQRGIAATRDRLQSLGATLIDEQGWEGFCRSVLGQAMWQPGASIVVDGARHAEVAVSLKHLVAPSIFLLVLVKTDPVVRARRIAERRAAYEYDLPIAATHSTEEQVGDLLPSLADLVIDGSQPSYQSVAAITEWLSFQ